MQIDRLGEQQRHQDIAVDKLNHPVDHHHQGEVAAPAELQVGHRRHRHGDDGGADVGDQHRQPHQHRKQHRVVQAQQEERQEGHRPHQQDLHRLAAHIVGDLLVHLLPDVGQNTPPLRQKPQHPAHQLFTVLEEEEHQQWQQHQKHQDFQHVGNRGQRQGKHRLAQLGQLPLGDGHQGVHLLHGNHFRVALRQAAQPGLGGAQNIRQLITDQQHGLAP